MRKPIILAAIVSAAFVTASAQTPEIHISKDNRTISVTASANAQQEADIARVHIGYQVFAGDEQAAYAAASQRSNAIFDALLAAGVKKTDIQSDDQQVQPVQPYENNQVNASERANRKFQASQSWTATCAAKDAANVLHVAVQAGANNSGGMEWDVKDEEALEHEAAAKAITRAKATAGAMASGLGIKLGPLVYASNEAPAPPGPRPLMMAAARARKAAPPPLAIAPRKVEKSATVTAVFAIE